MPCSRSSIYAAATAGILGVASLGHTVRSLDGHSGSDWLTNVLDLSNPALLALFVCWLWGRESWAPSFSLGSDRRTVVAVVGGSIASWWSLVVVMLVAFDAPSDDTSTTTDRIATALWFRPFGAPLPGLSVGVLLFNCGCAAALIWIIRRLVRQRGSVVIIAVVLAVLGIVVSVAFAASDAPEFGARSTLLGNLHVVALGIAGAELFKRRGWPNPDVGRARWVTGLAWVAPGTIGFGEPAFLLIARQYRDRSVVVQGVTELSGRLVTPFLWSLCVAVAAGVLLAACWSFGRAKLRHDALGWFRTWQALATVLAFAYFVRLYGLLAIAPEQTDAGDPFYYHVTANMLARGRGFPEPFSWVAYQQQTPSAIHGPLYPFVLSISSRLGGTDYFDHKMLSLLIGVSLVAATWALARHLGGPVVALTAAGFAAVYPSLWVIDSLMYPEALMATLVVLCVWMTYRWRVVPSWALSVGIGSLIGLAALARGEAVLLGPLMVTPWMLRHRDLTLRRRWQHLVAAGVACLLVLTPWMIRNASQFNNFVPLSNNGNEVLVYANCDLAYHGKWAGYWNFDCQQRVRDEIGELPGDESDRALAWRQRGVDYAKANADELPRVVAMRVLRQWELVRPLQNVEFAAIEGRDQGASTLGLLMFYGLAILSAIGGFSIRKRVWPMASQFVAVTITAAYTYGTIRFRAPAEPMLCVLGAFGALIVAKRASIWIKAAPAINDSRDGNHPSIPFVMGGRGGLRPRVAGAWRLGALHTWLALGAVGVLVAIPLRGLYHTTGGTMEEGFMLAFPERILAGDLPNRDFLHLYGPGSLHVLAGWFSVFGFTLEAERTFGLLQHVAIITALFTLARPWGRLAASLVAGLSVFLILTPVGLTAMAWNGGVALVLWSVVFALRAGHSTRRGPNLITAGLLAGLALTYRPDLALVLGLVYGWFIWRNREWREVTFGAVVGLIPMWVHMALVGPLTAFEGMFIDPVFRLRAGRELPTPPSWTRLDGSLQAVAELIPPWWGIPALPAEKSLFLWFFAMLAAPPVMLWVARRTTRLGGRPVHAETLTAVALISLGLLPQGLQRPDSAHLAWVTCVSFPFLILVGYEWVHGHSPGHEWPRKRMLQVAASVTVLMLVITPLFTFRYWLLHARVSVGNVQQPFEVERNGRRFYLGEYLAADATAQAIADLDRLMEPGETLIVGPADLRRTWYSDAFWYYLFPDLAPGTQFIEMDPGLANEPGGPLADELRANDWVVLTRLWDGWVEPNSSQDYGSDEPNQVIRDDYCLVGSYNDGLVELHRRCSDG